MAILQVIEWLDQRPQEIVQRVPKQGSGEFRLGSQLVVRESQSAVFFRDGKALDTFGPGRHTLTTANLPLFDRFVKLPFGESPFKAEVYFTSMKQFTDMKWGTPQPLTLRDADLGMVRLRAFGTYSMQIADPGLFVNAIVGTQALYQTQQIEDYLRSIIVSRLSDLFGTLQVPLLDLPAKFGEIGAAIQTQLRDEFTALGINLRNLYIESVSPTEETQKAIDERAAMGAIGNMQQYLQFKAARALGDAAQQEGGDAGGLTGAGFGAGTGAGLGAMMAQILGQSFQQSQAPPQQPQPPQQPASPSQSPSTPAEETEPQRSGGGPETVEMAFTGIELLVNRQIAVGQEERNRILQQLARLEVELAKPDTDLQAIRDIRKGITNQWAWLQEELDNLFRQPVIEQEMAEAARRFMDG